MLAESRALEFLGGMANQPRNAEYLGFAVEMITFLFFFHSTLNVGAYNCNSIFHFPLPFLLTPAGACGE